jgi:hypothetical protein
MPTAANSPASPPPHILVLLLSQAYEETIEPIGLGLGEKLPREREGVRGRRSTVSPLFVARLVSPAPRSPRRATSALYTQIEARPISLCFEPGDEEPLLWLEREGRERGSGGGGRRRRACEGGRRRALRGRNLQVDLRKGE